MSTSPTRILTTIDMLFTMRPFHIVWALSKWMNWLFLYRASKLRRQLKKLWPILFNSISIWSCLSITVGSQNMENLEYMSHPLMYSIKENWMQLKNLKWTYASIISQNSGKVKDPPLSTVFPTMDFRLQGTPIASIPRKSKRTIMPIK